MKILTSNINYKAIFWHKTKSFWKNKVVRSAPKSCRPSTIRRVLAGYKLRRSGAGRKLKLTDKSIRYAIEQLEKGMNSKTVAQEIGVTRRHVQRLWLEYRDGGKIHVQGKPGRPAKPVSPEEVKAVLDTYALNPAGVMKTTKNLDNRISHRRVYQIMKSNGLITASRAKSKKRK